MNWEILFMTPKVIYNMFVVDYCINNVDSTSIGTAILQLNSNQFATRKILIKCCYVISKGLSNAIFTIKQKLTIKKLLIFVSFSLLPFSNNNVKNSLQEIWIRRHSWDGNYVTFIRCKLYGTEIINVWCEFCKISDSCHWIGVIQ